MPEIKENIALETPEYMQLSTASAMALDILGGLFWRGASNPCINLLTTYDEGCAANCAFCGLARERPGTFKSKTFIKVQWPTVSLEEIIRRIKEREKRLKRVCISMITNPKVRRDVPLVVRKIKSQIALPVSVLITPSILQKEDLINLKESGVDRVGVAIDTATEELFDKLRGKQARGPHRYEKYWQTVLDCVEIFGRWYVGVHLIVGLGETEKEMVKAFQKNHQASACNHLFSFFAESGSRMQDIPQPPIGQYRRMQIARFLIDENISDGSGFIYNEKDQIIDFGIDGDRLEEIISLGIPFMTSGCLGLDGKVACNRPFGNSLPGPNLRNYPFTPNEDDLRLIRSQIWQY